MTDYINTTHVSIAFFNEAINMPHLLNYEVPDSIKIRKSKMNRSDANNYCISIDLPIKKDIVATLTVYAAKIVIKGIRPLELVEKMIQTKLDELKIKYKYKMTNFLDVTLYTLGSLSSIDELKPIIIESLNKESLIAKKSSILFKKASVHATGLKNEEHSRLVVKKFISMFTTKKIAPCLTVPRIYSIMSNSKYSFDFYINIWELASRISTAPGFDRGRSFCIYNNIISAHQVIIVLRENSTADERASIWRHNNNIETTYTVKNTGAVHQSAPSQEIGLKAFNSFILAIKFLGDSIKRK